MLDNDLNRGSGPEFAFLILRVHRQIPARQRKDFVDVRDETDTHHESDLGMMGKEGILPPNRRSTWLRPGDFEGKSA
jgi:hypothetical protein